MPRLYSDASAEASGEFVVVAPAAVFFPGAGDTVRRHPWPPVGGALPAESASITTDAGDVYLCSDLVGSVYWSVYGTAPPVYAMPLSTNAPSLVRTLPNSCQISDVDTAAGKLLYRANLGGAVYIGNIDGSGTDVTVRSGTYLCATFDREAGHVYVFGSAGGDNYSLWRYDYAGNLLATVWTITVTTIYYGTGVRIDTDAGYVFVVGAGTVWRFALADGSGAVSITGAGGGQSGRDMLDIDRVTQTVVYGRSQGEIWTAPYALGSWTLVQNVSFETVRSVALAA